MIGRGGKGKGEEGEGICEWPLFWGPVERRQKSKKNFTNVASPTRQKMCRRERWGDLHVAYVCGDIDCMRTYQNHEYRQ